MNARLIAKIPIPHPEAIAGVDDAGIARRLVGDLAHSLCLFEDESEAAQIEQLQAAIDMACNLAPGDTLEAQLIVQIVSSHNIAAAAMRRANSPDTNPQAQEAALKIAARFMALFREQTRTLTQYRGTPDDRARKCHRYGYDDRLWPENRHALRAAEDKEDEDEDDKRDGDGGEIRVNVEVSQCTPESEAEVRAIIAAAVSDAVARHRPDTRAHPPDTA